jgi:hypothetical protein
LASGSGGDETVAANSSLLGRRPTVESAILKSDRWSCRHATNQHD